MEIRKCKGREGNNPYIWWPEPEPLTSSNTFASASEKDRTLNRYSDLSHTLTFLQRSLRIIYCWIQLRLLIRINTTEESRTKETYAARSASNCNLFGRNIHPSSRSHHHQHSSPYILCYYIWIGSLDILSLHPSVASEKTLVTRIYSQYIC